MIVHCGPESDQRVITVELPAKPARVGILISGGIDSAILYHLLLLENTFRKNKHVIQPLTVIRKEGSKHFSKLVIAHLHAVHNIPYEDAIIVGDNTLPEEEQVKSGVIEAHANGFDAVYAGVIEQLPQFMVNWQPIPSKETNRFKTPLTNLNKSHIIDLCVRLKQEALFYITHSCSIKELGRCNTCNGCNERSWGFSQNQIQDPGML